MDTKANLYNAAQNSSRLKGLILSSILVIGQFLSGMSQDVDESVWKPTKPYAIDHDKVDDIIYIDGDFNGKIERAEGTDIIQMIRRHISVPKRLENQLGNASEFAIGKYMLRINTDVMISNF